MITDYNEPIQKLFLQMMLSKPELYTRVSNIINHQNFDKSLKFAAEFLVEYAKKYSVMPDIHQFVATTEIELELVDIDEKHEAWFLDTFESFTRRKELERAILKSADLLEKNDYGPVEKLIKDAVHISIQKDMGTDYFSDPRQRLLTLKNNNGQVSTGWKTIDGKLYGGFNRGELQIFAGGSGSGKSLIMQNIAVNWIQNGLNGVYITLELSEELCSMRIDGMVTSTSQRDIFKNLDEVEMKVKMMSKKSGNLQIKYMPAQSNVNDIRAYCKQLQIVNGKKLDFLCVDYLDLIMPVGAKVSAENLFIKDKYVSEELRNLAKELNVLFVTASQLNRSAVEEIEFDHSHISGGLSKINTADNVFGIFTSRSMRERGLYQLQLMKTRSSSGVGQKIELQFDIDTLRITDDGSSDGNDNSSSSYNSPNKSSPSDIMSRIRSNVTTTTTTVDSTTGEIIDNVNKNAVSDTRGNKLRAMLGSLKS